MSDFIAIRHGALCKTYEKQVNEQGFTYGDKAEFIQKIGFGLTAAHIHGLVTDGEYDRILRRFMNKILTNSEYLQTLERGEGNE